MTVDYKDLGKRIKVKREEAAISQAELAGRVDLSTQHISNIENAKSKVSLDKLVCIANELNTSVDELLSGSITKSRAIYHDDVGQIIDKFDDIELRALPEFLKNYGYLSTLLKKNIGDAKK